ncbi:sensor domain-containing diguanylate cyclase [Pollutimonas bauzanensis]|uniref:Diguanylate cyclase (GGDEF) domain-containing protein n=1 Tax=Pollutimonas bauzanensis TaxID=658167 RepID=A0A1M5ZBE0_9BURK|nr:sensor domain-containing diguanylate cyclase [Pollutimonas bauzanensis]SHI21536.1 diguanylate cyclase (GGDEF) domain-containing protein [Pollutimonas bauzanensis]
MQAGISPGTPSLNTAIEVPDFFDLMPCSLWLEDYSGLRRLFDAWRGDGVADLRGFLLEDPRRAAACSASIRVLRVNQHTLALYAADSFGELAGRLDEVLRDDMFEAYLDELEQLWTGQGAFQSKSVNYALDGRRLDILLKGVILQDRETSWDRVLVAVDDITELEDARRRAAASEQYARGVFEHAPVSLWVEDFRSIKTLLDDVRRQGITDFRTFTDVHPDFVERCMSEIQVFDVNSYTLDMFKAPDKASLLGRLPEVFRDEMRTSFREQLLDLWEGRLFQQREVINYALDGSKLHIHLQLSVFCGHEENWDLVLLALTDITARKKAEAYLEYLGTHDVLTTLKNRTFYVEEVKRLSRKGPLPITVIAIDLNGLKDTNDNLGHSVGDALLRRTGEVLSKAIEKSSQAARIGGDEFMVLLPGIEEQEGNGILNSIRQLVELNNQFYTGPALSLSMGIATCRESHRLPDALREADMAMYEDKRQHYSGNGEDRRQA